MVRPLMEHVILWEWPLTGPIPQVINDGLLLVVVRVIAVVVFTALAVEFRLLQQWYDMALPNREAKLGENFRL